MCKIEIIIGPMFSGKSTELLRRTSRLEAIGKNVLYINHIYDTRTDDYIQTHSNTKKFAKKLHNLYDINDNELNSADVLAIDEAQFFPDLYSYVLYAEQKNKHIIIAGLDGDYNRKPFGDILQCIPLCDSVIKLNAMDMIDKDGTEAIFSKRIVADEQQISVGATDKYIAVSRKNYLRDL
jgi:thymidine kinase